MLLLRVYQTLQVIQTRQAVASILPLPLVLFFSPVCVSKIFSSPRRSLEGIAILVSVRLKIVKSCLS